MDFTEIRNLFGVWDNSFGISEEEILKCEDRIGIKLPQVLREFYFQLGNNEKINQTQDSLSLSAELQINENGFVCFYSENQFVWQAGIKLSDFKLGNPPVYLTYDGKTWEQENKNLSDFLTAISYLQAIFALPFNANAVDIALEKADLIRQNWKKVESFPNTFWQVEFFQNTFDELIALMKSDDQYDIFIAAKTKEAFNLLDTQLNIEWGYNSLEE